MQEITRKGNAYRELFGEWPNIVLHGTWRAPIGAKGAYDVLVFFDIAPSAVIDGTGAVTVRVLVDDMMVSLKPYNNSEYELLPSSAGAK